MRARGSKEGASPASGAARRFFGKGGEEEFFSLSPAPQEPFFAGATVQASRARRSAEPEERQPRSEEEAVLGEEPVVRKSGRTLPDGPPDGDETSSLERRLAARSGGGAPLPGDVRARMEGAFGRDLGAVRIHEDGEAGRMAAALSAEAFTHGADIYFDRGRFDTRSASGNRLLAHELTHVAQQAGSATAGPVRRQGMPSDPGRFRAVHQALFTPGGGIASPLTWNANSQADLIRQFKQATHGRVVANPRSLLGAPRTRTTEAQAERDAVTANDRIVNHFPQLTRRLPVARIQAVVEILPPGQAPDRNFMEQWVANRLAGATNVRRYGLAATDPRLRGVVNALITDSSAFDLDPVMAEVRRLLREQGVETHRIDGIIAGHRRAVQPGTWSRILEKLASRQSAFAERGQRIVLNQAIDPAKRMTTLIHEFVHFYAHAAYKSWIAGTSNEDFFDEGFTEFLARQAMTAQQRTQRAGQRNNYRDRFDAINNRVAPFTTVDEIASAYFRGEVWRLEQTSAAAGQAFGSQVGIQPGASRADERTQSVSSPGIHQTVRANRHVRFMNLAIAQPDPKPEHRSLLQTLVTQVILPDPNLRIRFVGHASSTGSQRSNRALSRRRALAFYALARQLGVPRSQLLHAARPEYEGEMAPTADNDSVMGRAMNRRVELFIVPPGSTRLEDNVFRLGRLRGRGVREDAMTVSRGAAAVLRNAPDPDERLPFVSGGGWNARRILTALGQYDRIAGTDSDALRCVQAVAMASYIPNGPGAVSSYLELISRQARRTRRMNRRRRTALQVIEFVRRKLAGRTATFGDMSWAQEAVHDLFFDDVSGTGARQILGQITPRGDASRTSRPLSVWTSSPAELMRQARTLAPGEQLIVNTWKVLFNETFELLRAQGRTVRSPMRVVVNGRSVTIREIPARTRPAPADIDPNRDLKKGHQLLIQRDNSRRLWLYEPEVTRTGQHLFELTASSTVLNGYFRQLPRIQTYEYVQILGRLTPAATPAAVPATTRPPTGRTP